jgi:hypothetical protein
MVTRQDEDEDEVNKVEVLKFDKEGQGRCMYVCTCM